jgi:hypothetical protein
MSKLKQTKIPMTSVMPATSTHITFKLLTLEDNVMKVALEQNVIENEFNWKLVRERDGLTNESKEIMWVEWNEENKFKARHDKPAIGYSLIMSPFNQFFTWQTTPITEVLEKRENFLKFRTENSVYELWNLKKD